MSTEEILVVYDSPVLGKGDFWRGPTEDIHKIRNIPARELAKEVMIDGKTRKDGMWTVSLEKPE